MVEFLLEIGTEEIPARFIKEAKYALCELFKETLIKERIFFESMEAFATPRRLALIIHKMEPYQKEKIEIKYGPPINVAYDKEGKPKKEALAFARAQGVKIDQLKILERDGKKFVGVEKKIEGREVKEVLPELIGDIILRIPFPKKMRWEKSLEFVRPIRWIVSLLDGTTIRFSLGPIRSDNFTLGHRFLSEGKIYLENPKDYIERLKKAYVIVREEERAEIIKEGIRRIEKETESVALVEEEVLEEILYLTEYPFPVKGDFDSNFLSLPQEVIVNVMKKQRYIPLMRDGNLIPSFIFFANTIPKKVEIIKKGNEKVLKARLEDARFYFEEDRKVKLDSLSERLDELVFHFKIGTMKEKLERVREIVLFLSKEFSYDERDKIERAVKLMKVDLLTNMVREFPELQGKMGRIYAELDGEDKEVAKSIEEHYLPTTKKDRIPETMLGVILSIGDKIDTLSAFFIEGMVPTGEKDPYGLRRQALGIIRILIEKGLFISLDRLLDIGFKVYSKAFQKNLKDELMEFILTRFRFYLIEEGKPQDFVEVIIPPAKVDIFDAFKRLQALEKKMLDEDFKDMLVGFKRVYNITKTYEGDGKVDVELFQFDEEKRLFQLFRGKIEEYKKALSERRFDSALEILKTFKEPVDRFFEKVFVMEKDKRIRENRLNLLKNLRDMFLSYGDFSKLEA